MVVNLDFIPNPEIEPSLTVSKSKLWLMSNFLSFSCHLIASVWVAFVTQSGATSSYYKQRSKWHHPGSNLLPVTRVWPDELRDHLSQKSYKHPTDIFCGWFNQFSHSYPNMNVKWPTFGFWPQKMCRIELFTLRAQYL